MGLPITQGLGPWVCCKTFKRSRFENFLVLGCVHGVKPCIGSVRAASP